MPRIIAFSNQKGGVGKTTCTRELGLYLSASGKTVCLVDADPQANLTKSLTDNPKPGLYEALTEEKWELTVLHESLSLLAGNIRCAGVEKILPTAPWRCQDAGHVGELDAYSPPHLGAAKMLDTRMRTLFTEAAFNPFDYILIDCPPSLGVLTVNALAVAHYLVIPMNPSLYSMQGTNDLMQTVAKVKKTLNPWISLVGVIINAYERNPVITQQIVKEIEQSFGDLVFASRISKAVAIEEAIASRMSVTCSKSRVSEEIKELGRELLLRVDKEPRDE
jgi:chromosome partitioning protein